MCNSWSRIETFATSFFNLDFVLTAPSQARTLTNVPSSQAASSTIRDLFGGNGTGPTRCLRAQGSGADGTRTGCIVRSRTNGRDSQERVGSPTRIPESRSSGEGLPSGRRLAKRPGQAKWCVAPSGCLGHLGSVRPEKPEDNVPITDSRIGYRAAPTVSRVFPFWSPAVTPPRLHAENEASTRQFSPLSLRAIGVYTPRVAWQLEPAVEEMESRPVIADEQSLERLEDEEQDEEEDLDDAIVDELDEELDILGEGDLAEDDDEESAEAEEAEPEEEVEEEDDADDVVEDSESTSLEELLAQRTAARQVTDDPDEDDDFVALSSEARRKSSPPKSRVTQTLRNREEFVCKRCFLLKPKVQLADSERMLCRDCV
jgi:hypothetical protein